MQALWKRTFFIMCTSVLLASAGCAGPYGRNYGRIMPDGDVTESFEKHQIDSSLNYYISGSDVHPNAIMGLSKAYTLDSTLWKKVEMTSQTLNDLVSNMQMKALIQHGFALFDNSGNRIGIWYSILSAATSLWMKDDHTVVILTPALDTYDKTERRRFHRIP
ncbi:MAG: hypothetical protein E4H15_06500 [Syntrophobacterales bacterium]|nr:MAG: hypothetical protein E4H15_06500 [Syntrophobacterales bacterium]